MGFIFGLIKRLIKWGLYSAIFVAIIVLIPNMPPYTSFSNIEIEPTLPREGPLAPNTALNNIQKLYSEKILGPEAFQLYDGEIYTGLASGEIVKLSPGQHVTFVTKIGEPCSGLLEEHKCGRPLYFEIDEKNKQLYVADAYYGIWKVDLKTDKKQLLVSPRVPIEGQTPKLFNSIALDKNGNFYWTDSSSDFTLRDGAYSMMSDPSGRVFYYNAAKNESKVLLDKLWFANGLAISPDHQFIVVAETARLRLVKYYVEGPKKGTSEVFIAGLPGTPDNVRALPDGSGILVGLYTVFDDEHPLLTRTLASTPTARKFLARLMRLIEIPFEFLNAQFPHIVFETITYNIGNFKSLSSTLPPYSALLQIDWNGKIVASYYNTDGSFQAMSDGIVFKDRLYLGSPHNNFVGSVPAPEALKKAFTSSRKPINEKATAQKEVPKPKVEPKPVPDAKPVPKKEAPKVEPKPVPVEKKVEPKPVEKKVESKPAPVEKKVEPKPVEKKEAPKPKVEPKPVEKPVQKKEAPKVQEPAKPAPAKETKTTTPKPTTAKPVQPKPTPSPTAKQEKPQQKSDQPKTEPKSKPTESKTEPKKEKPKQSDKPAQKVQNVKAPEHIPIEENIPSDTAKPRKEPLKVIRKEGPAEIPNPNLV